MLRLMIYIKKEDAGPSLAYCVGTAMTIALIFILTTTIMLITQLNSSFLYCYHDQSRGLISTCSTTTLLISLRVFFWQTSWIIRITIWLDNRDEMIDIMTVMKAPGYQNNDHNSSGFVSTYQYLFRYHPSQLQFQRLESLQWLYVWIDSKRQSIIIINHYRHHYPMADDHHDPRHFPLSILIRKINHSIYQDIHFHDSDTRGYAPGISRSFETIRYWNQLGLVIDFQVRVDSYPEG